MVSGHRKNGDVPVADHRHVSIPAMAAYHPTIAYHPPPGFKRSAVTHTGVTATKALQLVEDRPFWQTIAMAGGFG